jgi:hypothetical protein
MGVARRANLPGPDRPWLDRAGFYEPAAVKGNTALKPCRIGVCAGHREDMPDGARFGISRVPISPRDRFNISSSLQADDLCPSEDRDVAALLDSADEVLRHAVCQA